MNPAIEIVIINCATPEGQRRRPGIIANMQEHGITNYRFALAWDKRLMQQYLGDRVRDASTGYPRCENADIRLGRIWYPGGVQNWGKLGNRLSQLQVIQEFLHGDRQAIIITEDDNRWHRRPPLMFPEWGLPDDIDILHLTDRYDGCCQRPFRQSGVGPLAIADYGVGMSAYLLIRTGAEKLLQLYGNGRKQPYCEAGHTDQMAPIDLILHAHTRGSKQDLEHRNAGLPDLVIEGWAMRTPFCYGDDHEHSQTKHFHDRLHQPAAGV